MAYPWQPKSNEEALVWKKPTQPSAPKPFYQNAAGPAPKQVPDTRPFWQKPWIPDDYGGTPDFMARGYKVDQPSPQFDYRLYRPPGWDKVLRPTTGAWGEYRRNHPSPYDEVSYWENPLNVARAYQAIRNAPPGSKPPDFLDVPSIEAAYKYMVERQGTEDWVNWKWLNPQDPARYALQSMPQPSMEWQLNPVQFQEWLTADLQTRPPSEWTDEEIGKLDPSLRPYFDEIRNRVATQRPVEDLATWQRMTLRMQQSPVVSGMGTMLPFAITGAGAGLVAGGPVGALLGFGTPLAMGAAMALGAQKVPALAELMSFLDVPAQKFEELAGVGIQLEGKLMSDEQAGTVQEILENWEASMTAGGLTYESGALFRNKEGGRWDITNILPGIEYGIRKILGEDTSMIQFTEAGEAFPRLQTYTDTDGQEWVIGDIDPVELDISGAAAINEARRRIIAGENPDAVVEEYVNMFGYSGEFGDLVGHIALDPLNVMPKISAKGVSLVARVAGNDALRYAFDTVEGPVHGFKKYQVLLREGMGGAADELSGWSKFIAGLDENGVIKELNLEPTSTNPVKRMWAHLADLTPEAKARAFVALSSDNIMNMMEYFKGDPESMVRAFKQLINETPTKMAEIADFLGSPEWATVRQATAGYGTKLDDLAEIYRSTEQHRIILNTITEVTGIDQPTILKMAGDAKTSDALMTMLKDSAAKLGDEKLQALIDGTKVEDLRQIMDVFTGDNPAPWHPDEFAARVYQSFGEHTADWAIKNFGVEKPGQVQRFWGTLKRAQSVVLLGFNPAYAVNNIVNNTVTRAATGIWGYATPAKIDNFWKEWGYSPYRSEAGVGIGEAVTSGIKEGMPGETQIRKAVVDNKRPGMVQKGIDLADKFGFSTKLSAFFEQFESKQATYAGTKKYWSHNWKRGKGFSKWSNDTRAAMQRAFPDVKNIEGKFYSIIEGSVSKQQAMKRIDDFISGRGPVHDIDIAIENAAIRAGIEPSMMRDGLAPVLDDLREFLDGARTPDEISQAYTKAQNKLVETFSQQISDDLQTRLDQVITQVGSGGFAEASRIFTDAQVQMADFWINDIQQMGELMDQIWTMRDGGVSEAVLNAKYRETAARRNILWQNQRKFERATWLGFLESMGADEPEVRAFLKGADETYKRFDDYHATVEERRAVHYAKAKEMKAAERKAAFIAMEELNTKDYLKVIDDNYNTQAAIDDIFVRQNRAMYGDDAARAADQWRAKMRQHQRDRSVMMAEHRRKTVRMTAKKRAEVNKVWYEEKYIPYIMQQMRNDVELSNFYSRKVSGDIPEVRIEPDPNAINVPPGGFQGPDLTPPGPGEVPIMISSAMRNKLSSMGFLPDEIHNMTPKDAWDNIRGRTGQGPAQAAPPPPQEPRPAPEGPTPAQVRTQNRNAIAEVAKEFGIETGDVTPDGRVIEQTQHLENILRKYGDPNINSIDDVTPQQVRQILEARERAETQVKQAQDLGTEDVPLDTDVQRLAQEKYRTARVQEVRNNYVDGTIDDLPPALQESLREIIRGMLSEFEGGRGDRRRMRILDNGQEIWRKWSDNVDWYRELYDESKKNRSTIVNSLKRMLNGNTGYRTGDIPTAKMQTLRQLKEIALGQLYGGAYENMDVPGNPGWFLHLGDEAEALSAFKRWINEGQILDQDNAYVMSTLGLDQSGMDHLWDLWDQEIKGPQVTPAPEMAPGAAANPVVTEQLKLYQADQAEIMRMKELAEDIAGVNAPSAGEIVPVGPQAMVPVFDEPRVKPHGNYPPGYIENVIEPDFQGVKGMDYYNNQMADWLSLLETEAMNDARSGGYAHLNIDPVARKKLNAWTNEVWNDMATHKIAAVRYGELLRDEALLNYSRKRGIDNLLMPVYPYQYWYTRSVLQWAQRAIDRPAWFANYARIRNFMSRHEDTPGYPSRLKGKMAIPAPYLPQWAGGELFFDPVRKMFPIEEFKGVIDQQARVANSDMRSAEYYLAQMYNEGQIQQQDVIKAIQTHDGPNWNAAMAMVHQRNEEEKAHPESWITQLMSPAAYLTYPIAMVTGTDPMTGQEPGQLPITRTGEALKQSLAGTPLQALGDIIGTAMSAPEKHLRGWRGISEFGGWGDYYVDRQITNMVNEGLYGEKEGNIAMIERGDNEIYQAALERVRFEQMLKVPGALPIYAAGHGGDVGDVMAAIAFGWMPANLLPDGEMQHRGLKQTYDMARAKFNAGDHTAIQEFFDEYPQYETRMALYKEPEERMRNFMINNMWDFYGDLGSIDKDAVEEQLGPLFKQGFLDDETGTYEMLDNQTLAYWLRSMGAQYPKTEETRMVSEIPDFNMERVQYADPNDVALLDAYKSERNQLFPNWYAVQQMYFSLPKGGGTLPGATPEENSAVMAYRSERNSQFPGWFEVQSQYFELPQGQRSAFLKANPMLPAYWDWSREQKKNNPAIEKFAGVSREGGPRAEFLQRFPELPAYWDWNKAVKQANPQIDYYTDPDRDDREPPLAAQYNVDFIRDFTPGLTRQLFDHYMTGEEMAAGTLDELITLWEGNNRPGDDYDYFFNQILKQVMAP